MKTTPHIVVLDDEIDITQLLANYLQGHGFRVTQVHEGRALMALMESDPADLVLLDLGLPGEDGFSIARRMREGWHCGLVIVTGRGDAVDKVVGLEVGADDYVTKPFDLRELAARMARDFLLEQTRGREAAPFDRTIDVQVGRLRKKIEADAEDPQLIKSVRGAGYILVPIVSHG